ncbi:MAG: hypothetical protein HY696_01395 [Deltaproteobacteria bacterium]|nr:hypothetical protein [Deltaproteobacteria bacterium]
MRFRAHYTGLLCSLLLIVHCGGSTSSEGSSTSSGSSSSGGTTTGTVTVTGSLNVGAVGSLGAKTTAASGYSVVAVNNASNATVRATTASDGSFSLALSSAATYLISYIKDGSYIGPTVFDGAGSEVTMGLAPSDDTALGEITLDTTNGFARTTTAPDDASASVTAVASGGIPVGAGNDGKTAQSNITNRSDSDQDRDGIPNLFDADEDNDGVRNGIAATPSGIEVVSDRVDRVYASSNIWADHDTTSAARDLIALRLHVVPVAGQEDQIASVACIDVPSSIADTATVRFASSLGDPQSYPTENSLWEDAGYGLYQTTTLANEEWIVSLAPHADMAVGDTFTIRVAYTDASTEDFFIVMSYVLTDWARIASYNGTTMPTATGTKSAPVALTTDTLTLVITKPTDEDGNILSGLSYSVRYGPSTASGGLYNVPADVTETNITDTGAATLSITIPTPSGATYYVTPVASSSDGQRNGEETWFTRE